MKKMIKKHSNLQNNSNNQYFKYVGAQAQEKLKYDNSSNSNNNNNDNTKLFQQANNSHTIIQEPLRHLKLVKKMSQSRSQSYAACVKKIFVMQQKRMTAVLWYT